jgi:hypothetical protein
MPPVLRKMTCAECGNPEGKFCAGGAGCLLWVIDEKTLGAMQAVIKAAREFVEANRAVMSRDTKGFDAFSTACDRVMAAQKALRAALTALDGGDPHGD